MKLRVVVAALAGGLALFTWGFVSHVVLGLADVGFATAPAPPADQAFLDVVRSTFPESGAYAYPGFAGEAGDQAAMDAWELRAQTEPHGLIVVDTEPYGGMGRQLAFELLTDVVTAGLAALLLTFALGCCSRFPWRVAFVALLGLVTAFRPVQQWNWYEFPCSYTTAQVADGVLGFLVMGLVIASIVKPRQGAPEA